MPDDSEQDKQWLQRAAELVDSALPDHHAFILMVTPFGEGKGERLRYVSTMTRESAINCLKEFLIKACAQEDEWLKHL